MTERPGIKPTSVSPSTVMASLSLYLIILAFFIMMNVISQNEGARTTGVINSINSSFKSYTETAIVAVDTADQGVGVEEAPGFEKSIEELFESAFPLAEVEVMEMLDRIEITLPTESMFAPGGASIQGKNEPILDRLADLLEFKSPGKLREVEALLSLAPPSITDGANVSEPDDDAHLAVNRAGSLARELNARGVRASAIAIGIERRDPDKMRLLFITRTVDTVEIEAGDKTCRTPCP